MKFKKVFFMGVFVLALAASLAFKTEKGQFVTCTAWDPVETWQCDALLLTDNDCVQGGSGAQCLTWVNDAQVPAYLYDSGPGCTYPLYHVF